MCPMSGSGGHWLWLNLLRRHALRRRGSQVRLDRSGSAGAGLVFSVCMPGFLAPVEGTHLTDFPGDGCFGAEPLSQADPQRQAAGLRPREWRWCLTMRREP